MTCEGCEFEARIAFTPPDEGIGWEMHILTDSNRTLPSGVDIDTQGYGTIDLGEPHVKETKDGDCHVVTGSGCVQKEVCEGEFVLPVVSMPSGYTMEQTKFNRTYQGNQDDYELMEDLTTDDLPKTLTLDMKDPACGAITWREWEFKDSTDTTRAKVQIYIRCKPCEESAPEV